MPSGIFTLKQQEQALDQGSWTNQPPIRTDYLIVAGGGGGGANNGGGGGGGGFLQGTIAVTPNSSLTVTVGAGGGSTTNGNNSVFGSLTAIGGGAGAGGISGAGSDGGSGGGGTYAGLPGQAVANQGNPGGVGDGISTNGIQGGGGGAGSKGINGAYSVLKSGDGGAGAASTISGTRTAYAGGGGSSSSASSVGGTGGAGGGGDGYSGSGFPVSGSAGVANTGGGGGGGSRGSGPGGAGGSGIVILSYPDIYRAAASTTGSPTISTSGSGGLSFNGSTQYLAYSTQSVLGFGTGDWTIEGWVYPRTVPPADYTFICDMRSGSNDAPVIVLQNSNIGFQTELGGNIAATSISANSWYHFAFVRNNNRLYCFLSGTLINSGGTATNMSNGSSCPLVLGARYTTIEKYLDGILTNFRILKGVGRYTSNFTPPTAPLPVISGTSILLPAISGSFTADISGNGLTPTAASVVPTWNASSPFVTGLGYKNRVYTWTSSGSITF